MVSYFNSFNIITESLQAEMEYRQKLYTHQIGSLTDSLQSTTLEKLAIEKQMLLNEANFQDMLAHREQQIQAHYSQSMQYRQQMDRVEPPHQLPPANTQFNRRSKQLELENLDRQIETVKKNKPTSIIDELEPLAVKMAKLTTQSTTLQDSPSSAVAHFYFCELTIGYVSTPCMNLV